MPTVLFIVSLAFLILGAELLVRGASSLAASFGVPALIVGLTVVAFGTSAPELAVSLKAALSDRAGVAVGNVIGSNTFNVLFILGLSALICPLVVSAQLIRFDVPLMIGVSVLVFVLGLDGRFGRFDGLFLFLGLVGYITILVYFGRRTARAADSDSERPNGRVLRSPIANVTLILVGLALLIAGSRWLVDSATEIARTLEVDELVISLTIVAAGTSLPEVVTSVVASIRGERDIAVGNVVGSNLFNLLGVLGLSSLIAPKSIDVSRSTLAFDLPLMVAVAIACLPIFFSGGKISRWEGGFLFAYYIAYTVYLVLKATRHEGLPAIHATMTYFVIPLTVVTLIVATGQAMRRNGTSAM